MRQQPSAASTVHQAAPKKAPPAAVKGSHNQVVREIAYSLYEARGRVDGHDMEDWLKAEAQVAQRSAKKGQAAATH